METPVVEAPVVVAPVVATPVDPDAAKTYTRKEFLEVASEKKAIADQKKTLEQELAKYKDVETKLAQDKAIAEGKAKELLDAAQKENESMKARLTAYEEQQKKLRDSALARIQDAELKAIAEKLPDVDSVLKFVEIHTKEKHTPFNGRTSGTVNADGKQFKSLDEMKAANPGLFG